MTRDTISDYTDPNKVTIENSVVEYLKALRSSAPEENSMMCVFFFASQRSTDSEGRDINQRGPGLGVGWYEADSFPHAALMDLGDFKVTFRIGESKAGYRLSMNREGNEIVML